MSGSVDRGLEGGGMSSQCKAATSRSGLLPVSGINGKMEGGSFEELVRKAIAPPNG